MKKIKDTILTEISFITPVPSYNDWWIKVLRRFSEHGQPGITYSTTNRLFIVVSETLIYRNDVGELVGLLEHFLIDLADETKGNINIMVSPQDMGKGIGLCLLNEAYTRMNLNLEQQKYTPLGYKLLRSFLKQNKFKFREPAPVENYLKAYL